MTARTFVIAEAGINHNGDRDLALALVDAAAAAGADAVKFQIRTPDICVPSDQRDVERDTPWGRMSYIDYRHRIELSDDDYAAIDARAAELDIEWFVSVWDTYALSRYCGLRGAQAAAVKIPSACLTDLGLIAAVVATGAWTILSTGMSTAEEVEVAARELAPYRSTLMQSTSTYPAAVEELDLRVIRSYRRRYGHQFSYGYSGHETGLATTVAAVALGATVIERHLTLDRSMWGTDQAASVEPAGFARLVRDIRSVEAALGSGSKRRWPSEEPARAKLRRIQ